MAIVWRLEGPVVNSSKRVVKALKPHLKEGMEEYPRKIWKLLHLGKRFVDYFWEADVSEGPKAFMPVIGVLEKLKDVRELDALLRAKNPALSFEAKMIASSYKKRYTEEFSQKAWRAYFDYNSWDAESYVDMSKEAIEGVLFLYLRGKKQLFIKDGAPEGRIPFFVNLFYAKAYRKGFGNLDLEIVTNEKLVEDLFKLLRDNEMGIIEIEALITDDASDIRMLKEFKRRPLLVLVESGKGLKNDWKLHLEGYKGHYTIVPDPYAAAEFLA